VKATHTNTARRNLERMKTATSGLGVTRRKRCFRIYAVQRDSVYREYANLA
jgi:hypothetical protein